MSDITKIIAEDRELCKKTVESNWVSKGLSFEPLEVKFLDRAISQMDFEEEIKLFVHRRNYFHMLVEEVERLGAENDKLRQDRLDYSRVETKEGLNASEWIWRTGKAERERDDISTQLAESSTAIEALSSTLNDLQNLSASDAKKIGLLHAKLEKAEAVVEAELRRRHAEDRLARADTEDEDIKWTREARAACRDHNIALTAYRAQDSKQEGERDGST